MTPFNQIRMATGQQTPRAAMTLDHEFYPDGKVLWGSLSATVAVTADEGFETGERLREWCVEVQTRLAAIPAKVAILKLLAP